jgi:hypothetical protein
VNTKDFYETPPESEEPSDAERPQVQLVKGRLPALVDRCAKALGAAGVYQRGGASFM